MNLFWQMIQDFASKLSDGALEYTQRGMERKKREESFLTRRNTCFF